MKNRKKIIVAFMLVACMLIGVGYAALSTTLDISGKVNITKEFVDEQFANDVYFSAGAFVGGEFKVADGDANSDSVVPTTNGKTRSATFVSNHLAAMGDYVVVEYIITNESDFPVEVSIKETKTGTNNPNMSSTNTKDEFELTVSYTSKDDGFKGLNDIKNDKITIQASDGTNHGTAKIYVKVEVKKPINNATSSTFGIELTVEEDTTTP